jgi:hypothetical protein
MTSATVAQTQDKAVPAANSETTGNVKVTTSIEPAIPKTADQLRQVLQDTNRRIETTEQAIKQSEIAASLIEEMQSQSARQTYSPGANIATVESANKSKNYGLVQSTLQSMFFEFMSSAFIAGPRLSSQELAPGTFGRKIINRVQRQFSEISEKYQKILQDAIPANYSKTMGIGPFSSNENNPQIRVGLSDSDIAKIKFAFGAANKENLDVEIKGLLTGASGDISLELDRQRNELRNLTQFRDKVNEASDKAKKEINELAITLGLPLFCGTVVVLFIIPFLARHLSKFDNDANQMPGSFQFSTLVEISTVLLLTMSILILGLAGKLDPPVLGTLLGGISGYVLNRTATRGQTVAE